MQNGIIWGKSVMMDSDQKKMDGDDKERRSRATREKMDGDMAFFRERVPWTAKRKYMDGDKTEDGSRQRKKMEHDMGERLTWTATIKKIDGDKEIFGERVQLTVKKKRWMVKKKKMKRDMAIFGGRVPSTVTRKKMDGDDKEDGWRQRRRWNKT